MNLLADLNVSQGTTVIVVTHDQRVARATDRILTMRDGRIIDDHAVADPLTEDLRELGHSRLGQRLLNGDVEDLGPLRQALTRNGRLTPEAERLIGVLQELV
jgi:ABC-type methionine transport system ATPase subunit